MQGSYLYLVRKYYYFYYSNFILLDTLKHDYHWCKLDNLYNSAKFGKEARQSKRKVFTSGVICKENRGVPSCFIQDKMKSKSGKIEAQNTVKSALLKGDLDENNFVMLSLYNTKPFYYFSTCAEDLK